MTPHDREAELAAARARLVQVLAEARRRGRLAPANDPIVSEPRRSLSRWLLGAVIALVLVAGWKIYRDMTEADRSAPAPAAQADPYAPPSAPR